MSTSTSSTDAAQPASITSARWLVATLLCIALVIAADVIVSWRMDVFGLFRDATGRALITSHHERKAKYLLNQAYVPDNFDALIIGASASVNWRPQLLTGYRFYDESLEGGNASEQRKLVEHALERGHFKVALVGLYHHITQFHELQDGLDAANRAEALGSLNAFDIEFQVLRNRLQHRAAEFYPDGSHEMPSHLPEIPKPGSPKIDITQDPKAVADYRALVEELAARGTRVIYVVYPIYGPMFDYNRQEIAEYRKQTARDLPAEPVIDLNAPEYASFRNDAANYIDDIHLSRLGSERCTRMINERMHAILHDQ